MEEKNAWDDYKISQNEPSGGSPIEALFELPDPDDGPKEFAKASRKRCLALARAWHICGVLLAIALIICGIAMAVITEDGVIIIFYLIAAFFAYMISETIAAVINLLVSKK